MSGPIRPKGIAITLLTPQQQTHNRGRSHIRAHVEHVFGHQVTSMGGNLIRTLGLMRARLKIGIKNLTYNIHQFLGLASPQKAQGA
jgi:transposase, IS5 family